MSDLEITFNTDKDGFISQECPVCFKQFKANFNAGSNKPLGYCPYCKHKGTGCWWTQAQADYATGIAETNLVEPLLNKMVKDINNSSLNNLMSIKADYKPSTKEKKPDEPENVWPLYSFECCGEIIKHDQSKIKLNCIICGEEKIVGDLK